MVKTCGGCWYFDRVEEICLYPVPWWAEHERPMLIGHGVASRDKDCPCWRERWVEAHKHTEGGEL